MTRSTPRRPIWRPPWSFALSRSRVRCAFWAIPTPNATSSMRRMSPRCSPNRCRRRGAHEAMNLAYGSVTTIRQFAETLLTVAGIDAVIEVNDSLPPGVNVRRATGRRLRRTFPGIPLRPLAEGLAATLTWYRHALGR